MVIKEIFDEFIRVVEENHKYTIGLVDKQKNIVFCSRQDPCKPGSVNYTVFPYTILFASSQNT